MALVLNSYDPANISGTSVTSAGGTGVNTLSAYGNAGGNGCFGSLDNNSSCSAGYNPFIFKHNLYFPIQSQYDGPNYSAQRAAMIMSPYEPGRNPPYMQHWCNWANFRHGGNSGPNSCDSGNWSATGDYVTGDSMTIGGTAYTRAVQWDNAGDYNWTNPMGHNYVVRWGQDDGSTCGAPAGLDARVDPNYVYTFSHLQGAAGKVVYILLRRFGCSGNPMDPANWQHWGSAGGANGTWYDDSNWYQSCPVSCPGHQGNNGVEGSTRNLVTPLDLGGLDTTGLIGHAVIYVPDIQRWMMSVYQSVGTYPNFTSLCQTLLMSTDAVPWGPYKAFNANCTASHPDVNPMVTGSPAFWLSTYQQLGSGKFAVTLSNNGYTAGDGQNNVLGMEQWQITAEGRVGGRGRGTGR